MPRPSRRLPEARAMIVAPQPEAVEAGAGILAAGGSAIDAVIACALTQGVVDPLMCGIGGLGILHLFDPKSGQHVVLDGSATCPAASHPEMWTSLFERECPDGYGYVLRGFVNELGHTSVATPGRSAWTRMASGPSNTSTAGATARTRSGRGAGAVRADSGVVVWGWFAFLTMSMVILLPCGSSIVSSPDRPGCGAAAPPWPWPSSR